MKKARKKRIRLDTWSQADALGFILFCFDCPRIWKTPEWAAAHEMRYPGHRIGTVAEQAQLEHSRA